MKGSPSSSAPPRLIDAAGPAGDCLRNALEQAALNGLPPRFAALRQRRARQLQWQRAQRATALLVLAAAALWLVPRLRPFTEPSLSISAEPASLSVAPAAASFAPAPALKPPPAQLRAPKVEAASPTAKPPAQLAEPRLSPLPEKAAAPAVAPKGGSGAGACADLARAGSANEALDCYQRLAAGGGMSAELALFEQARLEGKVLRQPARALQTLESHRRRFPKGSLRAEVMLAQIEWLVAMGSDARAQAIIDEALASGLVLERTAELERLRDTLTARSSTDATLRRPIAAPIE